ncbi:F0F1 ATP synthase subunit delta [Vallicoccus soli]|uniref:ATP synthase subunit delta n=1 Tax=Vallicoccus soli TaxID=2339232 RepID=A0A3A3Z635_9ACTN|nr:F0F1 ATP synthase subunit delta [Vallicoccus soli]
MQGASRAALAAARERLDALADSGQADLGRLAEELFAVADLLDGNVGLRRALADASRGEQARAGLAEAVLRGQVSEPTVEVLAAAARSRWSAPSELVAGVEVLAGQANAAAAEREGRLDAYEDELFRFQRTVAGAPALRTALSDASAPADHRAALVEDLLAAQAAPETVRAVREAVVHPRGRRLDALLELHGRVAAERRQRLLAHVVAATPLTEQQRERLAGALARQYGRAVQLNVDVDPAVVGGLRVQVGDELVDGTVARRFDVVRRGLAG